MYCENCGAEISKNSKFCNECGHEIVKKKEEPKIKNKNDNRIVIGFIVGILVLFGIALLFVPNSIGDEDERPVGALFDFYNDDDLFINNSNHQKITDGSYLFEMSIIDNPTGTPEEMRNSLNATGTVTKNDWGDIEYMVFDKENHTLSERIIGTYYFSTIKNSSGEYDVGFFEAQGVTYKFVTNYPVYYSYIESAATKNWV